MTKKEVKKATDNALIFDCINTYALLIVNYNTGRGTKQLDGHLHDLCEEMKKRNILTDEQVTILYS